MITVSSGCCGTFCDGEYVWEPEAEYPDDYRFYWNGVEKSQEEYERILEVEFDTEKAMELEQDSLTYEEIKKLLEIFI